MHTYNNNNTIDIEKCQVLQDVSSTGKIRDWATKKANNHLLSLLYQDINISKSLRLSQCATTLIFGEKSKKLKKANFCRVRLCPVCSWRRSMKIFSQTNKIIDELNKSEKYGYVFLTLTVKNCSDFELSSQIDSLMSAFKLLMKYKEMKFVKGYFRALEVTHNVNYKSKSFDTYHPHFHVIFAVEKSYFTSRDYISQKRISELWQKALSVDYVPLCDIRKVKGVSAQAISEVAKYSVKSVDYILPYDWDLSVASVKCLDFALNKRRLASYGGIFKTVHSALNLDDAVDGDLINIDGNFSDEVEKEIYFTWNVGYKQYIAN